MANLSDRYTELGISLGSGGGGGGGGFVWNEPYGVSPVRDELAGERIYSYQQGITQKLIGWVKVPSTYNAGNQVTMKIKVSVPSAGTDNIRMESLTYLVKDGEDAASTTNSHVSANADTALSGTSNAVNEILLELSDSSGLVNGVAVAADDLLRVELYREAPSGTEDVSDVYFIPSVTEVSFS